VIDLHSHILYGVDDGAATRSISLAMLDAAKNCGLRMICATPHYRGHWKDRDAARAAFADLAPEAKKRGLRLSLGAELYTASFDRDRLQWYLSELCYTGTNCILFELKTSSKETDEEEKIFLLQRAGMDVLIAHPERCTEIQQNRKAVERYAQIGCKFVLSADSLLMPPWESRRRSAEWLLKNKYCAAIASDAHEAQGYTDFAKLLTKRPELRAYAKGVSFE